MVGHPEWIGGPPLFAERGQPLAPEIEAWIESTQRDEVLDLAAAFRIPHAPIGNGATIPETDHFRARGSFVANPRDGFRAGPAVPDSTRDTSCRRSRRPRSASTPTRYRQIPAVRSPNADAGRRRRGGCRSRACGSWT